MCAGVYSAQAARSHPDRARRGLDRRAWFTIPLRMRRYERPSGVGEGINLGLNYVC